MTCLTCENKIPMNYAFCSEECHDIYYLNSSPLCIYCNKNSKVSSTDIMGSFCSTECETNHFTPAMRLKKMPEPEFSAKRRRI